MRAQDVIGTLIALWFLMMAVGGCVTPIPKLGPWTAPHVQGKTGMPKRHENLTQEVREWLCMEPSRPYPVMLERTCI